MHGSAGPLLRFHLRLGVRSALRSMIPLVVPPIAVLGLAPDPAEALLVVTRRVLTQGADPAWLLAIAMACLAVASRATRELTRDLTGWIRALPVDASDLRRGVVLGCITAQVPVVLGLGLLAAGATISGEKIRVSGLLGLLVLPACAAYAVLPLHRRALSAPCALTAAWLCVRGSWAEVAGAGILLVIAEIAGGPLRRGRRTKRFHRTPAFAFPFVVTWRAAGWSGAGGYLLAAVPIAIAGLALANNRLGASSAGMIVRLATGFALSMTIASLAQRLRSRPPWPWSRSLPRSSAGRVLDDALFLVLSTLPVILASCWLEPVAALTAALPVLWLAARAAGHVRVARDHPLLDTGSRTALDGTIVSGLVALAPWVSVILAILAVHALQVSARRDRLLKLSLQPAERRIANRSEVAA